MTTTTKTLAELALDPDNLRKTIDPEQQKELEQSIAGPLGLLEPLLVRPNGKDGHCIVVAGERRYRAIEALIKAKKLPKDHPIDVTIRDLSEEQVTEAMLIENLQRVDLNPVEEAMGFLRLTGFGWTQKQMSERIGRSVAYIASRVRLASLPQPVLDAVQSGEVTLKHADVLVDLVELAGPEALENQIVMRDSWGAERAVTTARRAQTTAKIVGLLPEGVTFAEDLSFEKREALKQLGKAQAVTNLAKPELTIPDKATSAWVQFAHDGTPSVFFYREMTPAEAKKAGLTDGKKPTQDEKEKARRAAQRVENAREREWAAGVADKPKVTEVNAFLMPLVRTLINKSMEAKAIADVLGIEPNVKQVKTYENKTRNERDFIGPVLALFDSSDANARRVAMAFFCTGYATRDLAHKTFGFKPKAIS